MSHKDRKVTLNFSEVFVDQLHTYASAKDMKVNAVLKRAFYLLQDHEPIAQGQKDGADGY
jgi:hypothetical protein